MQATWWFARQTLAARRSRTILLAVAVALSATLVMAVACSLESVRVNAKEQIERYLGETDVRVVHRFGSAFDTEVAERVRALPGVAHMARSLAGSLTLVRADGATNSDGAPLRIVVQARGLDADAHEGFRGQRMVEGRLPTAKGEVAVDVLAKKALKCSVGDVLTVQRFGEPIDLRVVGELDRPALGALQRPYVVVDRATLVEAMGTDRVTSVLVMLTPETDARAWVRENRVKFPDPLVVELGERLSTGIDRQLNATRLGFWLISMISFMSAAFIVGTGMTTAVAEQQRQLAIARCVGATRAQIFGSQLWAGMLVCLAGGALGVPLGMAASFGLVQWFSDLLPDGWAMNWSGIWLTIAGSLAAGVAGSLWPAYSAARTSPLAALAPNARPPRPAGIAWLALVGAGCIGAQLALLLIPDQDNRFWAYASAGVPLIHLGWFLMAVPIMWVCAKVLAGPLSLLLQLPRGLLPGAISQAPYRLGFTAGALMVGVSILVSAWSNATSILGDVTERVRISDGFVFKTNGMTPEEQKRVQALAGVKSVVPVGYLPLRIVGETAFGVRGIESPNVVCVGFPPDQFLALNRLEWIEGTPEAALPKLRSGDGVLVAKEFLVARGKKVGDTLTLGGGKINKTYEIVGVVGAAGLDVATQFFGIRGVYTEQAVSCVFIDFNEVGTRFGARDAYILQVDLDDSADAETDKRLAGEIATAVPGGVYASGRAIRQTIEGVGNTVLTVTGTVAFGALLLACVGVGNVVAANIAARRFEYGVLRASGATPALLVRLVCGELVVVAVAGAVTGTALGAHLARMGVMWHRLLSGMELKTVVPVLPISIGYAVLLVLTLAAAAPALVALLRQPARALLAR